jgi:hypothetical protein
MDEMDLAENIPNIDIVDSIDVRQILGLTDEDDFLPRVVPGGQF